MSSSVCICILLNTVRTGQDRAERKSHSWDVNTRQERRETEKKNRGKEKEGLTEDVEIDGSCCIAILSVLLRPSHPLLDRLEFREERLRRESGPDLQDSIEKARLSRIVEGFRLVEEGSLVHLGQGELTHETDRSMQVPEAVP